MNTLGYIRVAAASPRLALANPALNAQRILAMAKEAEEKGSAITVFPELALTGYSVGDLLFSQRLTDAALEGLRALADGTENLKSVIIVGIPLRLQNSNCYNCAAVIQGGRVLGIVPKHFIPKTGGLPECRWFHSGSGIAESVFDVHNIGEAAVPFGNLLFSHKATGFTFGVEICQDMWEPVTPGTGLCLAGALAIFNTAATYGIAGEASIRRRLVESTSFKNKCAYIYASPGPSESTTDNVFCSDNMIAEDGELLCRMNGYDRDGGFILSDIDFEALRSSRIRMGDFGACGDAYGDSSMYETVYLDNLSYVDSSETLARSYSGTPFIPENPREATELCREIFTIQSVALAERLERAHSEHAIVGVSGGSDSTLAMLVAARAAELTGRPSDAVLAITMPGFGTSNHTYNNALDLMRLLGAETREISIKQSCLRHFEDIGQSPDNHDVTYENAQARERTQVLMDLANKDGGLVVGTGDMSEEALGWCTYNGDHMAMYNVNVGIPKCLVKAVIKTVADDFKIGESCFTGITEPEALAKTLYAILDTPISPELLPPDAQGRMTQKTEDNVGPYELHDFFLFHTIKNGFPPEKVLWLATQVFDGSYDPETIKKWLNTFLRRFFAQQFKRSCAPDGPALIGISLSPRGGHIMPSDADGSQWQLK